MILKGTKADEFGASLDIKSVSDDGEIEGYASVFGEVDLGGDVVIKGAFRSSLKKRGAKGVKMLWQHRMDQPAGIWTDLKEDERGLYVKGRLLTETALGRDAHAYVKAGAVDGLSIGFRTMQDSWDRGRNARLLKEVDLREISLVTFPMNEGARVSSVKADFDAPAWEQAFRDGGLSNREAKLATSLARKMLLRDAGDPEPAPRDAAAVALLSEIRRLSDSLRG